jgi:hypothetical protein
MRVPIQIFDETIRVRVTGEGVYAKARIVHENLTSPHEQLREP